jgi:hypothetical protein
VSKRILILLAASLAAIGLVQVGSAADPPFPAAKVGDLFLSVQVVNNTGAIVTQVKPGDTVIFRAYSLDPKTKKFLTGPEKRYFYLEVPGVTPNPKFEYTPTGVGATLLYPWTASWTVPANYPLGTVSFRALVRPKQSAKRGSFLQTPVASSQLTVATSPQSSPADGPPQAASPNTLASAPLGLYVDSVNGTSPAGAAKRPVGCTQTNVYKRGEQFVLRAWGFQFSDGAVLSMDNVTDAHYSIAGVPDTVLNWGTHGATGAKVYFWSNQWQIPTTYPLGSVVVSVTFKTVSGATATFPYAITIIP